MEDITLNNLTALLLDAYQLRANKLNDQASEIVARCLKKFPERSDVQTIHGLLQMDQKKYFEAELAFNSAITNEPNNAELYFYLAQVLRDEKRFDEAEGVYLQCLKLDKNHFKAALNLGALYENGGRLLDAKRKYQEALAIQPDNWRAQYAMAIVYHKQNRMEEAIALYEKSLKHHPDDLAALSNLGAALTRDRQFSRALPYYETALKKFPDYVPALTNIGGTYIEMGDYQKGHDYMRRALAYEPNLPPNWRNLTLCTTFTADDTKDLAQIHALLDRPNVPEADKIHFYFALGKIYADMQDYDKAFNYYKLGNDLQKKHSVFVSEAFGSHISRIIKIHQSAQFPAIPVDETLEITPIIIMGTARSGKTLLENILKQHPQICGVGELGISDIPNKLPLALRPKTNYPYWIKSLTTEQAIAIRDEYKRRLIRLVKPGQKYIIDTMPGNYMYLQLLSELFPNVKFIHCERNALDACLVMYFKFFIEGHGYSYDLDRLGIYYKQYLRLMNFWQEHLAAPILTVHYESLIQEGQQTLASILEFIGLDSHFGFDTQQLHTSELDLWRHYEKHLDPLKKALATDLPVIEEKDEKLAELKDLMGTAYVSYEQGDTLTAEILCLSLLDNDPSHYTAMHLVGVIYGQRGELGKAVEYLEKAQKISPNVIKLHLDLSRVYQELGQQMRAENHMKIAENLQADRSKNQVIALQNDQKNELLKAFLEKPVIIDEFETRLLVEGKMDQELKTDSFMTRSWDHYFTDLSTGSFRSQSKDGRLTWRMRSWHFIFKNMALVENILTQNKPTLRILDIGCSTGYLRRILEGNLDPKDNKKLFYWGLDVRQDVLETAVKATDDIESGANGNSIPSAFVAQDIKYGLPYQDGFFDYVVCFEMIKYLPVEQGKQVLSQIHRVLSPKGLLYLSTTYRGSRPGFMQSATFEQVQNMIMKAGFEVLMVKGSQSSINNLMPDIKESHQPLVKELLAVHPPEMVAAMITPLYPHRCDQITFVCRAKV